MKNKVYIKSVIIALFLLFVTNVYAFDNTFCESLQKSRVSSVNKIKWTQFGPGNAGFCNFLRYHPTLPNVCFMSPDMGNTYKTTDNGKNWHTCKDVDGIQDFYRISDMYFSYKKAKFGIACMGSELYTTQDTGSSWQVQVKCPWYYLDSDGTDKSSWRRKISAIAIDYNNDDTWYVGGGAFVRGQQHLEWNTMGNHATASNPRGDDKSSGGENYNGKIWRTDNAGSSWTEISTGLESDAQFSRIIVNPKNSNMVFAASNHGLYKSIDKGENWTKIGNDLPNDIIMDMDYYYNSQDNDFVLYLIDQVQYEADGNSLKCTGGVYKSEDNGETWTNVNGDDDNDHKGLGLYMKKDLLTGGVKDNFYSYIANWFGITVSQVKSIYTDLPEYAMQFFNEINVDPSDKNTFYVSFYDAQTQYSFLPGRLWQTKDGGDTWQSIARDYAPAYEADKEYWEERGNLINDNMKEGHDISNQQWGDNYPLRSCRYFAVNPIGDIVMFYAHNTFLSTDKGVSFNQIDEDYTQSGSIMGHGDSNLPGECLLQDRRLGPGVQLLGTGEHQLWIQTTDGTDGRQAMRFLPNSSLTVTGLALNPINPNVIYTTSMRQENLEKMMRSGDKGETWEAWCEKATPATPWTGNYRTNSLLIDPTDTTKMYFVVKDRSGVDVDLTGTFFYSNNGGRTFSQRNNGLPVKGYGSKILFDPRDESNKSIFLACSAIMENWGTEYKGNGGLFHTSDMGENWNKISLPNEIESVNSMVFDNTNRLYIAAGRRSGDYDKGGVWYTDDYGENWTRCFACEYANYIDVSPFDNNNIIINLSDLERNSGMYLSEDRGLTWTKNNNTCGQPDKVTQVEFDINDPNRLTMAVCGSGFYSGVFKDGVKKISVSPLYKYIKRGETLQLKVNKASDFSGSVKFKSLNSNIATVDENGLITSHKNGAVKILAISQDNRYSDYIKLVVNDVEYSGIKEIKKDDNSFFYNVNDKTLFIGEKECSGNLDIYNILGDKCFNSVFESNKVLNLSSLKSGIYIAVFRCGGDIYSKRFMVK